VKVEVVFFTSEGEHRSDSEEMIKAMAACASFTHIPRQEGESTAAHAVRLAEAINTAGISVLLDVWGRHEDAATLLDHIVLARPAPIFATSSHVFSATSGHSLIDYYLTDAVSSPPDYSHHYVEKLAVVPFARASSHTSRYASVQAALGSDEAQFRANWLRQRQKMGVGEKTILLLCNHQYYKISPASLHFWKELLAGIAASGRDAALVFVSYGYHTTAITHIRMWMEERGVKPSQILSIPLQSVEEHLYMAAAMSAFVDTVGVLARAHTTLLDAAFAGLPILTSAGAELATRIPASIAHHLPSPVLVMRTPPTSDTDLARITSFVLTHSSRSSHYQYVMAGGRQSAHAFSALPFASYLLDFAALAFDVLASTGHGHSHIVSASTVSALP